MRNSCAILQCHPAAAKRAVSHCHATQGLLSCLSWCFFTYNRTKKMGFFAKRYNPPLGWLWNCLLLIFFYVLICQTTDIYIARLVEPGRQRGPLAPQLLAIIEGNSSFIELLLILAPRISFPSAVPEQMGDKKGNHDQKMSGSPKYITTNKIVQ